MRACSISTFAVVALLSTKESLAADDSTGLFECPPSKDETAANYEPFLFSDYETQDFLKMETSELVQTFRDQVNGDWGKTYEQVKEDTREWKKNYVIPYLKSGDKIYESASGIGLNLLFTLEILAEERPNEVDNLTIYGNEYLQSSVDVANSFLPAALSKVLPAGMARLGQPICTGDSTDLHHVPSNSFDFVFTGYISPINDLLNWRKENPQMTAFQIHNRFKNLCYAAKEIHALQQLEDAQLVQQDFYAKWVMEMIRITKPGQPIVIEQVSREKCDQITDNGGVAKEWWLQAIRHYKWPVDPDSLAFGKDHVFDTDRYHIFMRKLNNVAE